jgi:predicted MFS family arabinose efflux permease
VCATTSELGIVAALGALLLRGLTTERRRLVLLVVAVVLVFVGHLVHLLMPR